MKLGAQKTESRVEAFNRSDDDDEDDRSQPSEAGAVPERWEAENGD